MASELDEDRVRSIVKDMLNDLGLEAEVKDGQVTVRLTLRDSYWRHGNPETLCSAILPIPAQEIP